MDFFTSGFIRILLFLFGIPCCAFGTAVCLLAMHRTRTAKKQTALLLLWFGAGLVLSVCFFLVLGCMEPRGAY